MKRTPSKQTMKSKPEEQHKERKNPIDWAQKRASRLIMAPQPRLTEFKAVIDPALISRHQSERMEDKKEVNSSSLQDLIPICIARDLSEQQEKLQTTPYSHQIDASCLFLDVSQFTKISEFISIQGGLRGPEMLASWINQLFTQLVRLVNKAGGDIFKFAGDAVIILWPTNNEGDDLRTVARRAVQCAWDVQETLPKMELGDAAKGLTLAFKAGVGVGKVSIVHLGGGKLAYGGFETVVADGRSSGAFTVVDPRSKTQISTGAAISGRREYVAVGAPLVQAFAAEHHAQRNDIIVSKQTWSLVSEFFEAKKNKSIPDSYVQIGAMKDQIRRRKPEKFGAPSREWMLTYVPRSAHLFLEVENHTRKDWVSELRRVTVLFINLGVPKTELTRMLQDHEGLEKLHEYFSATQTAVMDYEGSINKYLMDDKGSTVIAVFGLPPISHENDATRGVLAALAISAFLQELGAEPSVGIATGIAFCGVVGHPGGRREYTILGDIVNLAARLMQRASIKQEGVLTDTETYYQAQEQIQFNYLKEVQVKGKSKRIDVWQPHQRGYKTKRTLLGKALGVKKHRRRRSLDSDWREQVEKFNERHVELGMDDKAIKDLRELIDNEIQKINKPEIAEQQLQNGGGASAWAEGGALVQTPMKDLPTELVRHEDERNLDSDSYDDLIHLLARILKCILNKAVGTAPFPRLSGEEGNGMQSEFSRGQPRSVVLEGSIGTGKSRILARLSAVLSVEPGLWVLDAACNPFERGALARPFGMFITLIGNALWCQHAMVSKMTVEQAQAALEDIPPSARRGYLLQWLSMSRQKTDSYYLLNEDFGVDFDMPAEQRALHAAAARDEASNQMLIDKKRNLIFAIFNGMSQDRRIACFVDDAVYLDSSSWGVALRLAREGHASGKGVCLVVASRPITDFVLIDANSRASYQEFQKVPNLLQVVVPKLPPSSVRRLATDQMQVNAIGPEIEVALEKCQGNPLFVRELVQSMMDKEGVLDRDEKAKVATFGTAAAMKLDNKEQFPACGRCNARFSSNSAKQNCRVCGHVLCINCCPTKNKRFAIGYKEPVQCCLDCSRDAERHKRFTAEAIQMMNLDPPVAIVCVIGTWIDKLTTPQQMILKVACLLRDGMRFDKLKCFEAFPLDAAYGSFDIEFDALISLGFVRPVLKNPEDALGLFSSASDEDDIYEFCHNFLPDVLNQRVLLSQKDELQSHVDDARARREEQQRVKFMQEKGNNLTQLKLKEGYVFVHKKNVGVNRKPWKPRWGVIVGHRIEFYYQRDGTECSAAADLKLAKVSVERGGFADREKVIRLQVQTWEKRGKLISEAREFYISPELGTDQEKDQWMYFLKLGIESENLAEDGTVIGAKPRKRGPSMGGRFAFLGRKSSQTPKEEPDSPNVGGRKSNLKDLNKDRKSTLNKNSIGPLPESPKIIT